MSRKYSSNKAWGRSRGNDSTNIPWNLGDTIPKGAGLPLDLETGDPISSLATFGSGTLEDPCILYRCRPRFRGAELDRFNDFASWICKQLGFTHIWIRSHVHNWGTQRDKVTNLKTGEMEHGKDQHITIYLGYKEDWINVHGHVYVSTVKERGGDIPTELKSVEELQLQDGASPRNPRLYVWTSDMTKAPSSGHVQAMSSNNWRAK
ncbi:hypothetical protein F4680DRAFT_448857 [Xylaria scruposa]|nr:hypothetical protein F4680DRAFT_448857 [Xylaria scruposa]